MDLQQLFWKCRFSRRYRGYAQLRACVELALEDESWMGSYKKLYEEAGKRTGSTPGSISRNIQTLLNNAWKKGGKERLEELTGIEMTIKPTSQELIRILAHLLKT